VAKFFGAIGYGVTAEGAPGVFQETITEKPYRGDVVKVNRKLREDEQVNNDVTVQNSISIIADAYANEHIFAMRYIRWQGVLWKITDVEVQRPRLILRLGGKWNGPKDGTPVLA
jgi:hypothetical protein